MMVGDQSGSPSTSKQTEINAAERKEGSYKSLPSFSFSAYYLNNTASL
jgi:hypothetical protein